MTVNKKIPPCWSVPEHDTGTLTTLKNCLTISAIYYEPGSFQQLVSDLKSTEKNHTASLQTAVIWFSISSCLEIHFAVTESKTETNKCNVSVFATIRVTGIFQPQYMGHLLQRKFGNPILVECQDALNYIGRFSVKSGLLSSWIVEWKKGGGGGGGEMWLLHSCPPTQPPSGSETDLHEPPDPKNVKLMLRDARQSLERKLRKFSGYSIAVCLLIIQSSS